MSSPRCPPPPPPPPPPANSLPGQSLTSCGRDVYSSRTDLRKPKEDKTIMKTTVATNLKNMKEFEERESDLICRFCGPSGEATQFISHLTKVKSIVQEGPRCGLVALAMASEMLTSYVEEDRVFQTAKNLGFTIQGEMFSAQDMLTLACHLTGCQGYILDQASSQHTKADVIDALIESLPILVPDHNNSPSMENGHKAHWALINDDCNVYVYAKQGKGIRTHLWNLNHLLMSNNQLCEVHPTINDNRDDYCLKNEGIALLRGKLIVLKYKS